MKKSFLFHLYPAVILLLVLIISGCSDNRDGVEPGIDLSGKWKITDVDNPENRSVSFYDGDLSDFNIPGNWLEILKNNDNLSSTVWIRKKVFIGSNMVMNQPLLFIERIGVADEAYFNGVKIGSTGIFPASSDSLHYQISWHTPRIYFIPDNLIKYGSENVVALRIYSHIQSGVRGEIALHDYHHDYFGQVLRGYKPLFISIAAVMLNSMLILVFTVLYISERRKTEYLYFTLVIICTLICAFLSFTLAVMIDGLLRHKLFVFFYTLANFFVLLGVQKFLAFKSRTLAYSASAFLLITELFVLMAPTSKFLVFYCGFASIIFVNFCILASAAMFINSIRLDPRRYWYFIFIAIPIPISVMRNSYYLFSFRYNELPLIIFLHVPMVFMFITLYYIYDFEKSKKEKEILYTALLRKSKSDIRMLKSLKDHNRKPEPRDLISSVVDYLDHNYAEKYDRIELSKKFGLNEDYMGQIFRKETGTNISNYINTNRINSAKELLADTSAKIIDIAYHVGFDNLTHFHRQFKLQTGCTPNEYRVNLKKSDT